MAGNTKATTKKMEQTFYDDEAGSRNGSVREKRPQFSQFGFGLQQQDSNINRPAFADNQNCNHIRELKKKLTLDFGAAPVSKKPKVNPVLTSPDLNLLKLASPELERMIIAHHGMITTTPTPGQAQISFPKSLSEEQELYARGFADALSTLEYPQHRNQEDNVMGHNGSDKPYSPTYLDLSSQTHLTKSISNGKESQCNGNQGNLLSNSGFAPTVSRIPVALTTTSHVKEEPQTVPCLDSSPPLSPVDMEEQEKIKLERKRLRNRVAASKCRRRKLERIARLEEKVSLFKSQNNSLLQTASQLQDQISRLKQSITEHRNAGCQITVNPGLGI